MAIFFMTGFMITLPSNVVGTMIIIGRLRRGKLYIRPLAHVTARQDLLIIVCSFCGRSWKAEEWKVEDRSHKV